MSATLRTNGPQRPNFGPRRHWEKARRERCSRCMGHGLYRSGLTGETVLCLTCRALTCNRDADTGAPCTFPSGHTGTHSGQTA